MHGRQTKQAFIDTMLLERQQVESLLGQINEEQMRLSGVQEHWSVKDIIAHLTFWEQEALRIVTAAANGTLSDLLPVEDGEKERLNAQAFAKSQAKTLEEVMAEWTQTFEELLEQLHALPETTLLEPNLFSWREGEPVWKSVASESYEHYREHIPAIKSWLQQSNPAAAGLESKEQK